MTVEPTKPEAAVETDVWGAITAFEQILEAMPDDTASLAVLSHAYGEIGDHAKAIDYLVRLGNILIEQRDGESAADLLDKLAPYHTDERIQVLATSIRELKDGLQVSGGTPGAIAESSPDATTERALAALCQFKVAEELSLAWNLMESGELTQDDYASVVQDLSELSSSDDDATVSVLHVLESRVFKGFDRIMGALARDSATPFVSLSSMEFQFQAVQLLPLAFCRARGALAFEMVGPDLLVVVLNPFDTQLRMDVEQLSMKKCHFFLTLPSEFDELINRYQQTMEVGDDDAS